jgi:hypothetical protein
MAHHPEGTKPSVATGPVPREILDFIAPAARDFIAPAARDG